MRIVEAFDHKKACGGFWIVQPVRSAVQVPVIEVAYKGDKWWSIPLETSKKLYACGGGIHVWDWEGLRVGSFAPGNEKTFISRYVIDFDNMQQRNLDNGRLRTIRVAWVDPADASADSAGQPVRSAAQVPLIEVADKADMWWSMPWETSRDLLYAFYIKDENACYVWDSQGVRAGSYKAPDSEKTFCKCYEIDFVNMKQRNLDNDHLRTIRIAWVDLAAVAGPPWWTGQIPPKKRRLC